MKSLITVMTARFPGEALRPNSPAVRDLEEFLEFLSRWEQTADKKNFLSECTTEGLRVTINSTLGLLSYLHAELGYSYLMTSRLSQDKIENLFGIVRLSSGCNAHPTPQQFLTTINCLSYYNLAKSVTGSNVAEGVVSSLLTVADKPANLYKQQQLVDLLLDAGDFESAEGSLNSSSLSAPDHPYVVQHSDSRLTYYVAGYVARKCVLQTKCSACMNELLLPASDGQSLNAAVFTKSCDFGGLLYPSLKLFVFISELEEIFTGCFSKSDLHKDSILDVLAVINRRSIGGVGCSEHCKPLTAKLISFYVVTRMHFYIKGLNKSRDEKRRSAQQHLKLSRL